MALGDGLSFRASMQLKRLILVDPNGVTGLGHDTRVHLRRKCSRAGK